MPSSTPIKVNECSIFWSKMIVLNIIDLSQVIGIIFEDFHGMEKFLDGIKPSSSCVCMPTNHLSPSVTEVG